MGALVIAASGIPFGHAAVSVPEGVKLFQGPLFQTSQRELFVISQPGSPARRLGRLPKGFSPPVYGGDVAWSVTTGTLPVSKIRLFRISPMARLEPIVPDPGILEGKATISSVAGTDGRFLYLRPSLRYSLDRTRLESGHFEGDPTLEIVQVVEAGDQAWYLAQDRQCEGGGPRSAHLVHAWGEAEMATVEVGEVEEAQRILLDQGALYLIQASGRVLRFDSGSLRLAEDLSPMLRGRIGFFSADAEHYWVQSLSSGSGSGSVLWRIDRDTLDGAPVRLAGIPAGFEPLADDGQRIWFTSASERHSQPILAVAKADGATQGYAITGRHARHWKKFGRDVGQGSVVALEAVALVPIVAVAIPLVPFILLACAAGGC
ncbi:MAG: hypothetical protein L0170_12780 [Acidobacteria bacterium]|nr:hypothetical protein [Acidobacteriota bacterium]